MKKLLFYGGTFDPPHTGHLHLLRQAMRRVHFDKIIVMPTALPPHKNANHYLSDDKRLGALRMLTAGLAAVEVSDWELQKGGKSYSIETVQHLREVYPEYDIWFLMGSDMFLSFEKWYRFEQLGQMCTLLAAPRTKQDIKAMEPAAARYAEQYGIRSEILKIPVYERSSTQIRSGMIDERLPLEIRYYLYGAKALQPLETYLKENLTPEKYDHSYRVAEYAAHLARLYGADEAQVYLASLLHDITKCWGKKRQLNYMTHKRYKLSSEDRMAPQIFHQITGALFASEKFCVRDRVILQAIKCHTTCKERMNIVDKILSLADSIEPARDYAGVEQIREMAEINLDKAVLMNLDHSIIYIVQKGFYLHPQTVAARNYLQKSIYLEEKNGK